MTQPKDGRYWITVDCPGWVEVGPSAFRLCGRAVDVQVEVDTYLEGEPDGHRVIVTDYTVRTIVAPCGHTFEDDDQHEAIYDATVACLTDGVD